MQIPRITVPRVLVVATFVFAATLYLYFSPPFWLSSWVNGQPWPRWVKTDLVFSIPFIWIIVTMLAHSRFSPPDRQHPLKEYPPSPAISTRQLWRQEDIQDNYGTYNFDRE